MQRTAFTLGIGAVIGFGIGEAVHHMARRAAGGTALVLGEHKKPKRVGAVIGVKRETVDRYIQLHKAVWPGVLQRIHDSNIRNYSIYLGELDDGNLYLFAYYEYIGDDYEEDMKRIAADAETHRWWKETDPLQVPQKNRKPGEHWMTMREVFHTD
jgi:L-rhamnose mutarotase